MFMTTESLWQQFHTQLGAFILKQVPDNQSAEDILQDVFLKVHTRIDTLRDEEKIQSWIYQIARNAIADHYRVHRSLPVLPDEVMIAEPVIDDNVIEELAPCIREMIDNLPPEYKQAILLTEYQGLTQRELAARLHLSFSGAKSRVQRARMRLKRMLLDCCHFEFDSAGRVVDYQPRCGCCSA